MNKTNTPVSCDEWNFHAERGQLIAEAHARPSQGITPPAEILHLAFRADGETYQLFFDTLGATPEQISNRHFSGKIDDVTVKIERHTEFMSCTLFRDATAKSAVPDTAKFLKEQFPVNQIEILVLLKLDLVSSARELRKALPRDQRIAGGQIRSDIDVRSTFKPDTDGITRFILHPHNQTSYELGRRLQRLIEMETYRTMSLLGLSKARKISAKLTKYEKELDELTISLRDGSDSTEKTDEELFRQISSLTERNNILATQTRYRFAASRAYYTLFQQRVDTLEEKVVGDIQTMSGFLRSRLEPAMATIESTAKRQETLTNDLSRALVLLRTRIELNLNRGNQALLQSMDRRHDQQLKISRTVEGLSIVAITYYAVGLVSYLLKALAKQAWMPFSATILTALSVPFILVAVWFSLKRARRAWEAQKEK